MSSTRRALNSCTTPVCGPRSLRSTSSGSWISASRGCLCGRQHAKDTLYRETTTLNPVEFALPYDRPLREYLHHHQPPPRLLQQHRSAHASRLSAVDYPRAGSRRVRRSALRPAATPQAQRGLRGVNASSNPAGVPWIRYSKSPSPAGNTEAGVLACVQPEAARSRLCRGRGRGGDGTLGHRRR